MATGDRQSVRFIIPFERVESRILLVRGQKVILDADLAELYGVPTKRLNEQVRRNSERFPPDFMSQLTSQERSEVVANCDHLQKLRFSPALPYAFTEHGVIMAASVLSSQRAVQASVSIVRAFVRLRQLLAPYKDIVAKLDLMEQKLGTHDKQLVAIVDALRLLMPSPEDTAEEPFGFRRAKKN